MIYVRGTLLGLAVFGAWCAAIAAVIFAAIYIEYWIWALVPATFIALGITIAKKSRSSKPSPRYPY